MSLFVGIPSVNRGRVSSSCVVSADAPILQSPRYTAAPLVVALESYRLGHSGDRLLAQMTDLDDKTIRQGREELAASVAPRAPYRAAASARGPSSRDYKKPGASHHATAPVGTAAAGDLISKGCIGGCGSGVPACGTQALSCAPRLPGVREDMGNTLHVITRKVEARAAYVDHKA
jgi:hypothetical protein